MNLDAIRERAQMWTQAPHDADTRQAVQAMLNDADTTALQEAFHRDLAFGTGGMRGLMAPGTNRMNHAVVAMATQGLADYILSSHEGEGTPAVAIAHDSRHQSDAFTQVAAEVLAGNGLAVHLFPSLRPTPELSFAIRRLGCQAGIVITASHNPKEYNGYKVYWSDGGQIVPPHDQGIIECVRAVDGLSAVKRAAANDPLICTIDAQLDTDYHDAIAAHRISEHLTGEGSDLGIVYSPLHGTGAVSMAPALAACGFRNVEILASQAEPDGDFPTVDSPNPEEASALKLALDRAADSGAQLVLATDPDSDRVGAAVRQEDGTFRLLNGNEMAALLVHYVLKAKAERGELEEGDFVARTVVTTRLISDISAEFDIPVAETLTGFKWIASEIREREGRGRFLVGGEESYGYLIGDEVRDKDAIAAACMIAEVADVEWRRGRTLLDRLRDLHRHHGVYREALVSLKREGISGAEEIRAMMKGFRSAPPATLGGETVAEVRDHLDGWNGLPPSNVIQFLTEDGALVTARPSGTESKIKFYFSVKSTWSETEAYGEVWAALGERMARLGRDVGVEVNV
ncbi:MAG: phospho-sugar mutase [Crocinitomicaceae bacterium TMED114]|nr:MAG: phospho-sugar mutase [Crocinitomicaceae bacterium TMED114]